MMTPTQISAMDRPNILVIVSEDCPPRFGCYGDPHAMTPAIDALAARGVLYENAYSTAPVCAPSRFSLITGRYPESHAPANQQRALAAWPEDMCTYPEVLREQGYYCTNNLKTDYNAEIPDSIWDECTPTAHWRNRPAGAPFVSVFNFDGTHEGAVFRRMPFIVDPDDVRVPEYLPDTAAIREDLAHYYRHIAKMDRYVAQLLRELEEDGLADSTIVIQTSDHGGVNPRSKRYLYDEGVHVPFIISAPAAFSGRLPAQPSRIDTAVSTVALAPTIIALGGGAVPSSMHECSLLEQEPSGYAFSMRNRMDERYDMIRTVRDRRYRYIRNYLPHRPLGQHQGFAWMAAGYKAWEHAWQDGTLNGAQSAFWLPKAGIELYDTATDPDEVHNLAGSVEHAEVERRLRDVLRAHMIRVRDNGFIPEGAEAEGIDRAGDDAFYPFARVFEVADLVPDLDPAHTSRFLSALGDDDPIVRRWGAIGLLALGPDRLDDSVLQGVDERRAVESDPFVRMPLAELLIVAGRSDASDLAAYAAVTQPFGVRLEALNALTAIDPFIARGARREVEQAAEDDDEYIGGAGRYLRLRLNDEYTPESQVFLPGKLDAAPEMLARFDQHLDTTELSPFEITRQR